MISYFTFQDMIDENLTKSAGTNQETNYATQKPDVVDVDAADDKKKEKLDVQGLERLCQI